jgi:hypothetical protein
MLDRIQSLNKPTTTSTSNITFRLISEASNKETNEIETGDLKLYLRNNSITVYKFL